MLYRAQIIAHCECSNPTVREGLGTSNSKPSLTPLRFLPKA